MPDEKSGWNQSHFYQYLEGESETLVVNEESRGFEFSKSLNDIKIKNQFYDFEDFWYFVNSTPFASLNPQAIRPLVGITIWDPYTFWFVNETRSDYGSIPHAPSMFGYKMDKIEDRKGIKELLDAAPEGDRITFMTYLDDENTDFHTEEWAADSLVLGYNLFSVLEGYGAKKVRLLEERGTVPYTLIFDKGGEVIEEIIGEDIYDFHQASTVTEYFDDNGEFNSTLIGPALKWDKVWE